MVHLEFELSTINLHRLQTGMPAKAYFLDKDCDAKTVVILPAESYSVLTEIAAEYSLMLAAQGKNIHGLNKVR